MIIYADENIETSIIDGLRRRRITVHSAVELGFGGKSDKFHLSKAEELGAIVLTHDVDFLRNDIYRRQDPLEIHRPQVMNCNRDRCQ